MNIFNDYANIIYKSFLTLHIFTLLLYIYAYAHTYTHVHAHARLALI